MFPDRKFERAKLRPSASLNKLIKVPRRGHNMPLCARRSVPTLIGFLPQIPSDLLKIPKYMNQFCLKRNPGEAWTTISVTVIRRRRMPNPQIDGFSLGAHLARRKPERETDRQREREMVPTQGVPLTFCIQLVSRVLKLPRRSPD